MARRPSRSARNARRLAALWNRAFTLAARHDAEEAWARECEDAIDLCAEGDVAVWTARRDAADAAAAALWTELGRVAAQLPADSDGSGWSATSVAIRWEHTGYGCFNLRAWEARRKAAARRAARAARRAASTALCA